MRNEELAEAIEAEELGLYPDNNPKSALGALKVPVHLVPPALLIETAKAFSHGAVKYGPYNWREHKISSSVYYGALQRHVAAWWDGEDLDPESGAHHLAHAAACLALLLDTQGTERLNDDRPRQGPAPDLMRKWNDS